MSIVITRDEVFDSDYVNLEFETDIKYMSKLAIECEILSNIKLAMTIFETIGTIFETIEISDVSDFNEKEGTWIYAVRLSNTLDEEVTISINHNDIEVSDIYFKRFNKGKYKRILKEIFSTI